MLNDKFKDNQEVVYLAQTVKGYLETGRVYTVEHQNEEGGVKIYGFPYLLNANQFVSRSVIEDKAAEAFAVTSGGLETENKKSENKEDKVKFKNKPGSAVVYYVAGSEFHLNCVEEIVLDHVEGNRVVSVTRTYQKDGINFTQTADIPVDMLDKIEYVPKNSLFPTPAVVIKYNYGTDTLDYTMTFSDQAVHLF